MITIPPRLRIRHLYKEDTEMKKIEKLELDVILFDNDDVIATSQPDNYNDNLNGDWV